MSVLAKMRGRSFRRLASGLWLLIHGADEIGTFDSFGDAAARAVEEFGVGSYLVRTALASTVTLPASVVLQQA